MTSIIQCQKGTVPPPPLSCSLCMPICQKYLLLGYAKYIKKANILHQFLLCHAEHSIPAVIMKILNLSQLLKILKIFLENLSSHKSCQFFVSWSKFKLQERKDTHFNDFNYTLKDTTVNTFTYLWAQNYHVQGRVSIITLRKHDCLVFPDTSSLFCIARFRSVNQHLYRSVCYKINTAL